MSKVFILRPINSSEAEELLRLYNKSKFSIYYDNSALLPAVLLNKIPCQSIYNLGIDLEAYNKKILQLVVDFGQFKVGGRNLNEILHANSIHYWYYLKFSLYHRSKIQLIQFFLINQTLKAHSEKSDFIKIYTSSKYDNLSFDKDVELIYSKKEKPHTNASFLLKYSFLFSIRAIFGTIIYPFRKRKGATTLILTNTYNRQDIIDLKSEEAIKGDPHLHYLLSKTKGDDRFQYLSQLRPPGKEGNHRLSINDYLARTPFSKKTIYFEPYLLLGLLSPSLYKRKKKLELIWNSLIESIEKESILSAEEQIIFDSFKNLKKQIYLALWREEAAKIMIKNSSIKKVLAIDEHSLQNKSIFNGLKQKHIGTIAIQHGAISQSNISYKFSKEDLSLNPFPDLTLVRGNYTKEMLLKNNYPENQLKVVGHIRTDVIPRLLKSKNKLKLFGNNDKPLILYATQPLPESEQALKKQLTEDFFKLCNDFPNCNFVLKPHPNEGSIENYLHHPKNNKLENFKLFQGELYQLLARADAVITYYSTVGIEAIYFNKPLLTIDYHQIDAQGYLKEGVSTNSHNYAELKENLSQIIESGSKIEQEKLDKFIANRVFKIDGKVAERCFGLIK